MMIGYERGILKGSFVHKEGWGEVHRAMKCMIT